MQKIKINKSGFWAGEIIDPLCFENVNKRSGTVQKQLMVGICDLNLKK